MKKHFIFFIIGTFLSVSALGQSSKLPTLEKTKFYFYTIFYGLNKDVYVSEIYDLEIGRGDLYKQTKERYETVKNFLIDSDITEEVQSGYEKNYFKKDQAEHERDFILYQLRNQEYKIISFKYK